ncbi:hypothetical protein MMC30_003335 [Trapelia coarctata]|nr:hypothetical protein [Trapelia coarctata]
MSTTAMETASMSCLPPELLPTVFCSLDRLEDVANLSSVSRTLYDVRNANAHSICLAVAPRSILYFLDAEALLKAQEQKDSEPGLQTLAEKNRTARSRMRRLVVNSRMVLKACAFFENDCRSHLTEAMEATEYRRDSPSPLDEVCALADGMRLRELVLLRDVVSWAAVLLDRESAAILGYISEDWLPMFNDINDHVIEKSSRASARPIDLTKVPPGAVYSVCDQYQQCYVNHLSDVL